jgi:hypothetical protein
MNFIAAGSYLGNRVDNYLQRISTVGRLTLNYLHHGNYDNLQVHFLNYSLERLSNLSWFIVYELQNGRVVELEPSGLFVIVSLSHDIFGFRGFEPTP